MTTSSPQADAALIGDLFTARAVRERAGNVTRAVELGQSKYFNLDLTKLATVATTVAEEAKRNYPTGAIPFHSRLRHLEVPYGTGSLLDTVRRAIESDHSNLPCVSWFDLMIVSVLLDAGAGPDWKYRDKFGAVWTRSEGLAVASAEAFLSGTFSAFQERPLRVDAERLCALTSEQVAQIFQASDGNRVAGIQGRAELLRRLGERVTTDTIYFPGTERRPGNLWHYLRPLAHDGALDATDILCAVLQALTPIWPTRIVLEGVALGDVWQHPFAGGSAGTKNLIPFHKLSQWLTYSLLEPIRDQGIKISNVEGLTALAEYRNGGLLIDADVIKPQRPSLLANSYPPGHELVVEWRALTITLLDRLLPLVRDKLHLSEDCFSFPNLLQAGTWSAGRSIARTKRPNGAPPIQIQSDGTIF